MVVQKVPLEVLLDCSFVMKRREEEVQPQQGDEGTLWHLKEYIGHGLLSLCSEVSLFDRDCYQHERTRVELT